PIDPWGVDRDYEDLYREVLAGSIQEDVDVVAVGMDKVTPWAGENETHLGVVAARALITASEGRDRVVPLMFTIHSTGPAAESVREPLRAAEIPLLHGLRPAMLALRHAWWWQQWPARSFPGSPPARHGPQAAPAMIESGPVMSERASREYLSGSGIPFVPGE